MRIGIFTDTYLPDINGVASSIITLRDQLIKDGHVVYIITNHPKLFKYSYEHGILRVTGIELKFLYGYTVSTPWHLRAYNQIRKMNLDVIHAQTEFGIGIFARICASRLNIPLVSTYHTTYEDYTHYVNFFDVNAVDKVSKKAVASLSRLYAKSSRIVISPSRKTKEMLEGYGITTEIVVIPSGLDLSQYDDKPDFEEKRLEIRKEYGFQPSDKVFIYIGRIAQEKSLDVAIRAFARLRSTRDDVRFLIIGGGPGLEEVQQLALDLDQTGSIIFAGKKELSMVPYYYYSAEAFISASLTETQGVTFIESLASKLPVFARPDEPLEEIVIEAQTGYYFENEDEFVQKANQYLSLSDAEILQFKARCRSMVDPYDSRIFSKSVLEVYDKAIHYSEEVNIVRTIQRNDEEVSIYYESEHTEGMIKLSKDLFEKYDIKENSILSKEEIEALLSDQSVYTAYIKCIKKLAYKDYSEHDMLTYLYDLEGLEKHEVDQVMSVLKGRHFLNDQRYIQEIISALNHKYYGAQRIRERLERLHLNQRLIENELLMLTESGEQEKANKAIEIYIKSLNRMSISEMKQKVRSKLARLGFESSIIESVLSQINFDLDEETHQDNLRNTIQKAQRIYKGKEARPDYQQKVIQYAVRKGYRLDEIKQELLKENEYE